MISRRRFLTSSALTFGGFIVQQSAFANRLLAASTKVSSTDYRALVCINLDGGNDGNNMVVPMDSNAYSLYKSARQGLAIPQNQLLQIGDGHRNAYGLHPSLVNTQRLYTAGNAALVANVGPLVTPIDRASFLAKTKAAPTALEDHEVQRLFWGTAYSQLDASLPTPTGWGGRVADLMTSTSALSYPVLTSLDGVDAFTTGNKTSAACIATGVVGGFPTDGSQSDLQLLSRLPSDSRLVTAAAGGLNDAITQNNVLVNALGSALPVKTTFPATVLGQQLQQVAACISARAGLGTKRQVFMCRQMAYDNHTMQMSTHASLLAEFDAAVGAFFACMEELGLMNEVTLFTQSDFGRSLAMNGSAGSDHAWGNHHLVVGGAVQGGQMYGRFPDLTLGGPDDLETTGRWIPTLSIEQYASPLASWFGVPSQSMSQVFPNIGAFPAGPVPLFG